MDVQAQVGRGHFVHVLPARLLGAHRLPSDLLCGQGELAGNPDHALGTNGGLSPVRSPLSPPLEQGKIQAAPDGCEARRRQNPRVTLQLDLVALPFPV